MKTFSAKAKEIDRHWYVIDAEGRVLGRLAADVAAVLMGKHKPAFTPHLDTGDFVIVTNAAKVAVTGRKMRDKMYYGAADRPGGLKSANLARMLAKHPTAVVERAVRGMLPHNRLGRAVFRKLKVYAGPGHPHQAQEPRPLPRLRLGR